MRKGLPVLLIMTILSGIALSSSLASADTEVIDTVELTVPVACTMSGTGQTSHNASLSPGTYSGASGSEYEAGIGKTTITTYCNDNNGFSIYAIGFTDDLYEGESHTKLIGQNTNQSISTKVYANGDTDSNWSMKVTKVDNPVSGDPITYNPDNMSIQNSFNSWHAVPDVYTKVAQYNSSTTDPATTDTTLGAKIETTYATYISSAQAADTYTGQVKYTMVHPYNHSEPEPPSFKVLYTGRALSTEPGQENPVTVRMADLPQDGKYNLLGTDDGLYDKLTPGTLYGGYYTYNDNYDDFEDFMENYDIYDGTNIDFSTIATVRTVDGASVIPSKDYIYIVREVPETFLTPYMYYAYNLSTLKLTHLALFSVMDNKSYRQVGFDVVRQSDATTEKYLGTVSKTYTYYTASGDDIITPTTINANATSENNRIFRYEQAMGFLAENEVFYIRQYWITPDRYKVTGANKQTLYCGDLTTTNLSVTKDYSVPSTITKWNE